MQSWVRRSIALAALAGAVWFDIAARGALAHASTFLPSLEGDGIVELAGPAAVALVGLSILVALSQTGRRPS
jgi:hypothetical protein